MELGQRFIILIATLSTVAAASSNSKRTFRVALYRDQAYVDHFNSIPGLSETEALKIHVSGIKYFLSYGSLQPEMSVEFIMRDTLFSFEEYGISTTQFLEIFGAFQTKEMTSSDRGTWNHALLLTGNASKPNGMTFPGGFCATNQSSSVVMARSIHLTPLLAAQYIARNMGMEWDPSSEEGDYVMTQKLSPGIYKWSEESQNFWKAYVAKQDCFKSNNASEMGEDDDLLSHLPGFRINLQQQCQAAHGQEFTFLANESTTSPCQNLVCDNSTIKESLHVASLPGSYCDTFKYCWKGDCQSLKDILQNINDGFIGPSEISLPGPTFIKVILNSFLRVIRLINFLYNRL